MYNYRIEIEYDGGRYDGWQRLGKDASTNTIESRLCEIITRMTGETVVSPVILVIISHSLLYREQTV